jgi:hypothetical protein
MAEGAFACVASVVAHAAQTVTSMESNNATRMGDTGDIGSPIMPIENDRPQAADHAIAGARSARRAAGSAAEVDRSPRVDAASAWSPGGR